MPSVVTVAIPTLNAGADFVQTLTAVRDQQVDWEIELLICDSESSDGTPALARAHDATVIEIPRESFSHGGTRNLLMAKAEGHHVAFLTQDAVPASDQWLGNLLKAFTLADDVGLAFGPYRPRPGASPSVVRELTSWFDSLADDGPRVDVLQPASRGAAPRSFLGPLGFFTDANGCVARAAWEHVPFRHVAYAEDHLLAQDMLRAGFAKVYMPDAAVVHSHDYAAHEWMRRSFDEARAMREVYNWGPGLCAVGRNFRGNVKADWRWLRHSELGAVGSHDRGLISQLAASVVHHGARSAGFLLGSHADSLPRPLVARMSLERRP